MNNKWTREKCLTIAKKYKDFKKFREENNDVYLSARRNQWIEEIKSLFPDKPVTKWSDKKAVIKEARKYTYRKAFVKGSKGAYEAARLNNWLEEACAHMDLKTNFWNFEACEKEAKKYKTRKEFQKNTSGAYGAALKKGWLELITTHMDVKLKKWEYSEILELASNYPTKVAFIKAHKPAYLFALRRDWIKDILAHIKPLLNTWNKKKVLNLAKTYKSRSKFTKENGSAAQYAVRNGFYEEACEHMEEQGSLFKRMLYAYEFADKSVYVGLTYKESKRKYEHLNEKKGPVAKHISKTNLEPRYKKLEDYMEVKEAKKMEQFYIEKYKNKGWKLLNSAKGGALGGNKMKWTKEQCAIAAKKFQSKKEFTTSIEFSGAVQSARRHGWMEEICSHMSAGNIRWNKDKCINEAKKHKNRASFMRKSKGAYNYALRNKILDELFRQK
jgi:hypothetical protein